MAIIKDVFAFVGAVLRYWVVLMGGLIMTIITLIERKRGNAISPTVYWPVIIGFVAVAMFLAWRKEREQVIVLSGGLITASVKELVSVYGGRTQAQGSQLAKTYKGKLMKFRGVIENIREEVSPFPFLTRRQISFKGFPSAIANFSESWNAPISALQIGDVVTVIGKIRYVSTNHISLHRCEIVELGEAEKTDTVAKLRLDHVEGCFDV